MNLSSWTKGRVDEFFVLQRGFDITEAAASEGNIPVISSSGFSYFHSEAKVSGPGVVTGRKGRVGPVYYIEKDHWPHDTTLWVKDFKGNLPKYVYYFLQSIKLERYNEALAVPTLNRNNVHTIKCAFPPLKEQEKIVDALSLWDNAIEKTEALIAAKEKQFEWLCTNLLSGRKKSFGFTGKSIPTAFASIFSLFKKVNTSCADYEVLSVTKDGIVSQSEYFNKEIASKDKSKYLIVDKDTLVMSGLNFWMGAIDFQTIRDTGIVSPAYKTFKVNEGPYNRDYLRFFIRSHYMTKILLDSSIQGASIVRRNLDMEWLSNSLIDLPNLEEQIDIANILSLAEKEIDGLKLLAEKYRSQKRGLLQKLLTGEWQVGSSQHLFEETYQEASA